MMIEELDSAQKPALHQENQENPPKKERLSPLD